MDNAKLTVNGRTLTITVDLDQNLGPSSTGKTDIIATTHGAVPVPGHATAKLNLSIYTKR